MIITTRSVSIGVVASSRMDSPTSTKITAVTILYVMCASEFCIPGLPVIRRCCDVELAMYILAGRETATTVDGIRRSTPMVTVTVTL